MAALRIAVFAAALAAACRTPRPPSVNANRGGAADDVTLYRDIALIRQRVELALPATPTTVKVTLASGVAADQIVLLDRGGLAITAIHALTKPDTADDDDSDEAAIDDEGDVVDFEPPDIEPDGEGPERDAPPVTVVDDLAPARKRAKPTVISLDVAAPQAGTYAIVLGYTTDRLRWDVAYTMTAAATRDRVDLRGALAIRNETGIELHASTSRLIDAELGPWRIKSAEQLAATLVGGTQSSTPPAAPRDLGRVTLGDGETRVDLGLTGTRPMRSVLVYDPIGTRLDNPGAAPLRDPTLGTTPRPSSRVSESFEIARDTRGTSGLPAGPVRLLERKPDTSLTVLGESRLFDASTRVSDVDTIAIGTAEGVTATRERREFTLDDEARRVTEELVITIDNQRAMPVEVLVREHLYRGQNWTLAYHSAPEATKDGPQQISLRTRVPARSKHKILYVVVYTWGQ